MIESLGYIGLFLFGMVVAYITVWWMLNYQRKIIQSLDQLNMFQAQELGYIREHTRRTPQSGPVPKATVMTDELEAALEDRD